MNVGIIGCGAITRFRHAPEFYANPDCKIFGFYDWNKNRTEELAGQYGGQVYNSYQDMLKDTSIDSVVVCTSNATHSEITIDALKAGKNVLCEKPMSISVEEAESMRRAEKNSGKKLMISHNQRYDWAHLRAKELLDYGVIGDVIRFEATFAHGGPENWSIDKGGQTWFFKKGDAHMGAMGDLGVHKIDLMMWMLSTKFTEAIALIDTLNKKDDTGKLIQIDDNAICILRTDNNVVGTVNASWTYEGGCENSVVLYGTKGIMRVHQNPTYPITVVKKNGEKMMIQLESQKYSGVVDAFINCVVNDLPSPVTSEEGIYVMKVIKACFESSEKKCAVRIER